MEDKPRKFCSFHPCGDFKYPKEAYVYKGMIFEIKKLTKSGMYQIECLEDGTEFEAVKNSILPL